MTDLSSIERAKSVQELARIMEVHVRASQGTGSDLALMSTPQSTSGKIASGPRLSLSQLSALCTRLATLMEAGAHPGLEGPQATSLAQKLLSQASVDLAECPTHPSAPLHINDIQQFLDSWARLSFRPTSLVRSDMLYQLSSEGGNQLCLANSKTLSSIAWSLQKLGWASQQLMHEMLDLAGQHAPGFDPDSLNLFAKMLRTNGTGNRQAYLQLGSLSRPLLPRLTPSELSMLLLTLVQADAHSSVLFSSAAQHILPHINNCMPRDLAWLATAYAQAGFLHKQLFQKIAVKAEQHAACMDRKELTWLVRAFTMLRIYDAVLYDKLDGSTQHYLKAVLPRELKEQRIQYQSLQSQGSVSSSGRPKQKPSGMSGYNAGSGLSSVGTVTGDPINAPSQLHVDLADLAWGFAKSGHYTRTLFDAIAEVAADHMCSFDAQKLGQLCWAFKAVQHHDRELMETAADHALTLARDLVARQQTLPAWSSWEQQTGYQTAGCSWLPFFPGPGSIGRPTGSWDLPPTSLADTWGLVSVMSCLGSFSEDCSSLMQTLHPLLVHVVQPQQQHAAYGRLEELVLLLEPLVQQLQLKTRGWNRHFAELALQVILAVNGLAKAPAELSSHCKTLVLQAYIAMDDAGWGQEVATAVGGGLMMKDTLRSWKERLTRPPSKERAAWQSRLVELLGSMGASSIKASACTPDGLFGCLLLATVRGRRVAIDFCGSDAYASNVCSSEPSPDQRGSSSDKWQGASSKEGGAGARSKRLSGAAPPGAPIMYSGELPRTKQGLPTPSTSLQPLFNLSFRARGLRQRGWVPLLLPATEWIQVVGSEVPARMYLELNIRAALNSEVVRERD